jgi:hypothetical protein
VNAGSDRKATVRSSHAANGVAATVRVGIGHTVIGLGSIVHAAIGRSNHVESGGIGING